MSRYEVTIQDTRVIKIGVIASSLDAATELAGAALDDSEYSKPNPFNPRGLILLTCGRHKSFQVLRVMWERVHERRKK